MRVLLTGGGTAGHINPALAIADLIRRNAPGSEIAFVGIRGGREEDLVPREGYPLFYVDSAGFSRPLFSPKNLRVLRQAVFSPFAKKTTAILDQFHPDVVIGTGGYACWPIMAAAARRRIPTAVHESNAIPGLTIKRLKNRVDRVWINFESTADALGSSDRILRVGNPLRESFGCTDRRQARERLGIPEDATVILSFGGSLGAEHVNTAVLELMHGFVSAQPRVIHFHAAGKRDFGRIRELASQMGLDGCPNCLLSDYFYDMPDRMAAADLVISRAGAMTLSELALTGKAAILIPSPYVADDHQTANARALAERGAAVLIPEASLAEGTLTETVRGLLANPGRMEAMRTNIRRFADPDAGERIWGEIVRMTSPRAQVRNERRSPQTGKTGRMLWG